MAYDEFKMKYKFGEHYKLNPEVLDLSGNPVNNFIQKIQVIMQENLENAVCDAIAKEAEAQGFTDLFVLNKKAIFNALSKQIPEKIDNISKDDLVAGCHCCGEINALYKLNGDRNNYCGNCGQKINWGEQ